MAGSTKLSSRKRWGTALFALLPAAAFVGLLAFGVAQSSGPPRPGDEAPRFEAPLLGGGGSFALADAGRKPVLLNFWASWCVPCRDEAPMLRRAHELYGEEVAFVGVDVRDSESDAERFAERHGLDYTHVRDEGAIYADYGLTGQPETFLIGADGVIVEHVPGAFSDERHLFGLLDVLVARHA